MFLIRPGRAELPEGRFPRGLPLLSPDLMALSFLVGYA